MFLGDIMQINKFKKVGKSKYIIILTHIYYDFIKTFSKVLIVFSDI